MDAENKKEHSPLNLKEQAENQIRQELSAFKSLGFPDRFLAVWIFLAMAIGIILGNFVPSMSTALKKGDVFVNCIFAPFLMLGLSWAFLPDKPELRTGLILVGLGRCIAMVLIWNGLAGGSNEFCAILVAINSILQMVLFAPLAIFFIFIIDNIQDAQHISHSIVATGVAVFLGIPLGAAIITRITLRGIGGPAWYERVFIPLASPWSLIGFLYTVLVLFASQDHQVVHQIVSVIRVAAPLIVYFIVVFFSIVVICRLLGFKYECLATQGFTAASNNVELAIAVAVSTFGSNSDQALASTIGPLIEVPILLGLVYILRWIARRWNWK
ncbi:arsenical-resistance [Trichoderma arundinaceum]|uniref:Arsenical-resistance n=1 Tax=Trichoderma arundinaceum TaxID=490622 RepID=A0A395NRJ2_TRIAR|nr:arsenical-resistance [Trichoderma arundinaceum]